MTYHKKELTTSAITSLIDERLAVLQQEIATRELAIKELMDLKWKILMSF